MGAGHIEPQLGTRDPDNKPSSGLIGERREVTHSHPGSKNLSNPTSVRVFRLLVSAAVAMVIWVGWAYLSAAEFISALNSRDKATVEDYVDRASLKYSVETIAASTFETAIAKFDKRDNLPPIEAFLGGAIAAKLIESLPPTELFELLLPKQAQLRTIWPNGIRRFFITYADQNGQGVVLILSFRDFGWKITGIHHW